VGRDCDVRARTAIICKVHDFGCILAAEGGGSVLAGVDRLKWFKKEQPGESSHDNRKEDGR